MLEMRSLRRRGLRVARHGDRIDPPRPSRHASRTDALQPPSVRLRAMMAQGFAADISAIRVAAAVLTLGEQGRERLRKARDIGMADFAERGCRDQPFTDESSCVSNSAGRTTSSNSRSSLCPSSR